MEAVGSYIQTLRDKQSVSRARMAEDIGTTENTLWRIESGRQEPGVSLLARILQYVQGSIEDVFRLAARADATVEDGRREAQKALLPTVELSEEEKARLLALSPEQRRLVLDLVAQMRKEIQ